MANCFRCGRVIDDSKVRLRRRVKTGEWIRRGYASNTVAATQTHYGMRVVCKWCAKQIDIEDTKREIKGHKEVLIAIGILFLVMALALYL